MYEYRLFFYDAAGHLTMPPYEFSAEHDQRAISIAEAWREGRKMELWRRDRPVRSWGFPTLT